MAQLGVAAQRRQLRLAHEDDAGFAQPIDDVERLQHVAAEATQLSHEMMRSLVQPWPDGWPDHRLDLNAAAIEAGGRDSTQGGEPSPPPCPRRMESRVVRTHP